MMEEKDHRMLYEKKVTVGETTNIIVKSGATGISNGSCISNVRTKLKMNVNMEHWPTSTFKTINRLFDVTLTTTPTLELTTSLFSSSEFDDCRLR
uniref:Uncharacterized protein n=1 Tax=Romanomermis culicivorax TaxID=13658 RepID=A0A915HNQ2_ROMCU